MAVSLESSASNDPQNWRSFPPTVLKKHTCVLETQPAARNADIADALFEQGYEDVICVQIVGRSTKVTFRTLTTLNHLCETEFFYFRDSAIPVKRLITALTEIQILDVPVWVEDSTIVSALSIYGEVMGKIRHGQVLTKSGMLIATGVRFSSFKKKNLIHLPSYVKTGNNNFRVRYDGQPETCRLCNQQGYFAAACPAKNRTHSHPKGRPTTGTVTTYADAASAPAPVGQVSLTITDKDRAKRLFANAETPIVDQDSRSHEQHLATDKDVETELASAEAEESETHDTTNYKNATTGRKKRYQPSLIFTPICTIKRQRNISTTPSPSPEKNAKKCSRRASK